MSFKNKYWYLAWVSFWILAGNLVSRAIFWPEKALFSWNIPICVLLIMIMWRIGWHFQSKVQKRLTELRKMQAELEAIEADIHETGISAETWAKIEDFLKHSEAGVRRDISKRRKPNDHNPES